MSISNTKQYREGARAYRDGRSINTCAYTGILWDYWLAGFRAAEWREL
jgi:ribosome modulation factor